MPRKRARESDEADMARAVKKLAPGSKIEKTEITTPAKKTWTPKAAGTKKTWTRKPKGQGLASTRRVGKYATHKVHMQPKDAPDPALHRALINAPFQAKLLLGPNYQRAKLNTGCGAMPSRLIEQRSVVEVTIPAGRDLNIFVLPSLLNMVMTEDNAGAAVNALDAWTGGGLHYSRPAQGIDTQFAGVSSGRCLSMGAELISTENVTAATGQIGAVSFPGDPTGKNGVAGQGVSQLTMQDLSNMEGAVVGRPVEGIHCFWKPEESVTGLAHYHLVSTNVETNIPVRWRYDDFKPIGWTRTGTRASTVNLGGGAADTTDYFDFENVVYGGGGAGDANSVNIINMMPGLFFRVESGTALAVYKMTIVQHWEVYDYKIGADRSKGHDGVRTQAHRGLVGTITHDVGAAVHEVENVAGEALHGVEKVVGFGEKAFSVGTTIAKDAMLLGALL